MKERPILFSAPMIRAILEGRKTVTRRLVKPQPAAWRYLQRMWGTSPDGVAFGEPYLWREAGPDYPDDDSDDRRCPYGAPGDRMWVKETWSADARSVYPCDPVLYRADVNPLAGDDPATADHVRGCKGNQADCYACLRERHGFKWRPSIHMRRDQSRIDLEIAGVRVERLQAITEEDARAEGVLPEHTERLVKGGHAWTAIPLFRSLWDGINCDRASWASNPHVWVVSFKRVRP